MVQAVVTLKTGELLEELEEAVQRIYGDNLRDLYLYGSHVRQQQTPQSDVDIIIVLKDFADYWREIQRTSHVISELSLKYDVTISPVRVREVDWREGKSPFLNKVRRESVPV